MKNAELTIIIGKRSNLSQVLNINIENSLLISSMNIVDELDAIEFEKYKKVYIIFNNFQMATQLNDLSNPGEYIERSIGITTTVLDYIIRNKILIEKLIYTSSSSVYGNNILCSETDQVMPLNLHASLKLANEKLIEKFASDENIDYTIVRIFNMYGGEDKFSIISKIIGAYKNNTLLTIVNNGNGIRDFIHIEDVANIYPKLLELKNIPILNVGTGEGVSIKSILDYLKNSGIAINTKSIKRKELKISTADNSKLIDIIGMYTFKNVEKHILNEVVK